MNVNSEILMAKKEEMKIVTDLIKECKRCSLYKSRKNPVNGFGSLDSKVVFIGEAPGRNEDFQGKPFVGRAGKILDDLLKSINLERSKVFIGNILKCRPPNNRNPLKKEIDSCTDYLDKQLKIIKPKIIAPLGNFSSIYILNKYGFKAEKISKIHGKVFEKNTSFGSLKIIPLFHPAVAVYNSNKTQILIKDFKIIKELL